MTEKYIIGERPIPEWAAKRLMQYKKTDGTTGFEFYGDWVTFELKAGDTLIKSGRKINIERKLT